MGGRPGALLLLPIFDDCELLRECPGVKVRELLRECPGVNDDLEEEEPVVPGREALNKSMRLFRLARLMPYLGKCVYVRVCVGVCVSGCVCTCVCACVRVCV